MRLIKLLSITFLLACLTIGTMVACDGDGGESGNGELAGEVVSCEEVLDTLCSRFEDCQLGTFEECILIALLFGIDCDILVSTATQECIDELNNLSCEEVNMGDLPDPCEESLEVIGGCEECEDESDCEEGLICIDCVANCTGNVKRCTLPGLALLECEDGAFKTLD